MIRSICRWGAGRSSMKPERVRGVCFAITLLLYFNIAGRVPRGGLLKKSAVLPKLVLGR